MGQCLGTVKNETISSLIAPSITEPDWAPIKAINVYGIPKNGKADLKWEFIESLELDDVDARSAINTMLGARRYDEAYFVNSMHYQLSTVVDSESIVHTDTISYLASERLHPTTTFDQVCEAYFDTKKLLEIKRMCMC